MSDLPTPDDTGVAGTQVAGSEGAVFINPNPPIHGLPITQAMEAVATSRPRSLGGEVAASLIAASFTQLAQDLEITRGDLRARDEQLRVSEAELSQAKVMIAKLNERVGSISKIQLLKKLSVFSGTVILSLSIDLYKSGLINSSYLLGLIGVILLLTGGFTNRVGGEQ